MGFVFCDLDDRTRTIALSEVESDITSGTLAGSTRFSEDGTAAYPDLLRDAIRNGDEDTLAAALTAGPFFVSHELAHRGTTAYLKKVPTTAARTFAEGEFNRFYLRGLALRAEVDGYDALEVYRAKRVAEPRAESEALIGVAVAPDALLVDLRSSKGLETHLGLPQPNSGLSARIKGLGTPCQDPGTSPGDYRPGCAQCLALQGVQ